MYQQLSKFVIHLHTVSAIQKLCLVWKFFEEDSEKKSLTATQQISNSFAE
jgi:hypothetical protein